MKWLKKLIKQAKLQFAAGQAKPGPALAGVGINMPEFTKAFNDQTRDRGSEPVPVLITVYEDKSFDFKLFTSPTAYKLIDAAKVKKGSSKPNKEKIGSVTLEQVKEIAEYKLPDLNTNKIDSAIKQVAGTARNMGITIEGYDEWLKGGNN
ncbi:50S ribosomal protein L11 [Mycoplasma struthionis]|uniref:Large ribosomal subunit protein uL11 n=1 Tax=Mycoplasma struthionis TaxID=538220 RepID=A0A502M1J1_9MOLU|nr:50S ribosomal protein L11 [Mycoplasma struthionis]